MQDPRTDKLIEIPKKTTPTPLLGLSAAYACVYSMLINVAKKHGYALAIHGSVSRDLDLIAVPWVEDAAEGLTLIKAFKDATGCVTTGKEWDDLVPDCEPTIKPHGRLAYSLHFTEEGMYGPYIDISVMPRESKQESPEYLI